jgi:tetratricopeptide (TPR) repeat protein
MKMISYIIVIFSMILFYNDCFGQSVYESAMNEYLHGDLNKSIELFTSSIKDNNKVSNAYMYRGMANAFKGRFPEAVRDLDSSQVLNPANKKIDYAYAKIYLIKGDYSLSLSYSNLAINEDPENADAYDERAAIEIMIGNYNGAIKDENAAIKIDSSVALYFTNRGFAKFKSGNFKDAITDFNNSIQMSPSHKAYADRGLTFHHLNQDSLAINDYSKALEFYPNDGEIHYWRGISYKIIGKKDNACVDFKTSGELGYSLANNALIDNGCK